MNQTFPKTARLLNSRQFDRVFRSKHYAADGTLVITGTRNGLAETRLGLSVSKKVGNAVERNRWKRRIREAFRIQHAELPAGFDLVVRPKKGAACNYHAIKRSIAKLTQRLDHSIAKTSPAEQCRPTEQRDA